MGVFSFQELAGIDTRHARARGRRRAAQGLRGLGASSDFDPGVALAKAREFWAANPNGTANQCSNWIQDNSDLDITGASWGCEKTAPSLSTVSFPAPPPSSDPASPVESGVRTLAPTYNPADWTVTAKHVDADGYQTTTYVKKSFSLFNPSTWFSSGGGDTQTVVTPPDTTQVRQSPASAPTSPNVQAKSAATQAAGGYTPGAITSAAALQTIANALKQGNTADPLSYLRALAPPPPVEKPGMSTVAKVALAGAAVLGIGAIFYATRPTQFVYASPNPKRKRRKKARR